MQKKKTSIKKRTVQPQFPEKIMQKMQLLRILLNIYMRIAACDQFNRMYERREEQENSYFSQS